MIRSTPWTFILCCLVFWLAALLLPIRWVSHFLQADYRHLYNHAFYAFLIGVGLVLRLHARKPLIVSFLSGALAGEVSSMLSILLVTLSRPGSLAFFSMHASAMAVTLSTWLLMSIFLGGPLIGGIIALICSYPWYGKAGRASGAA